MDAASPVSALAAGAVMALRHDRRKLKPKTER